MRGYCATETEYIQDFVAPSGVVQCEYTMTRASKERVEDMLSRRIENVFPSREEAIERLSAGKPLRIYMGFDPTGPNLHIGHTVPFIFLKQLMELGHKPVVVLGDFTARIGDPTGKDVVRTPLTEKQVVEHMGTYIQQLGRVIPADDLEVRYNSEWLRGMALKDVIELASRMTVQQMLAREMFQERLKKERPIFLHEFLYPLMQGYDSVALDIDGEVGGNDQTFNMLVGRDLIQELRGKDKLVFAAKLLVNTATGKKMSKTEGEIVALNDSPQETRRKILDTDDGVIRSMFELCTERDTGWIQEHVSDEAVRQHPRELKEELSDELVRMYHGEDSISEARTPIAIKGADMTLAEFLVAAKTARSRGEAKALIEQRAILIDDQVVTDWNFKLPTGAHVKVGKGKFFIVH